MAAARKLRERYLADATYVLIGLLYVTGLRSGEAFGLDVEDLDHSRLVLSVRGKLDRQRLVPVHPSTAEELRAYCGSCTTGPLLVGRTGQRLEPNAAHAAFRRVLAACDLDPQRSARSPRLHDFRHTLAVDSLVEAHRRGLDVDARIAVLSTFLGHKDPAEGTRAFQAYAKALDDAGVLASAEVLQQSNATTTVTLAAGELVVQDGPFADTNEQLGGTFVIDVSDLDAAIEWARRAPSVSWGHIEIRPTATRYVDGSWQGARGPTQPCAVSRIMSNAVRDGSAS
jgi:hypothetical protein